MATALWSAFLSMFIPQAQAYFKNGNVLTAHFLISMESVADSKVDWQRWYDPDGKELLRFRKGEDILPMIKTAYAVRPIGFFKEIAITRWGNFGITESWDTLHVTDLKKLAYLDTKLTAYLACPTVTRHQAKLLENKVYFETVYFTSGVTDYKLINTNPAISWQEMFIYSLPYIEIGNDASLYYDKSFPVPCWYQSPGKQDTLINYLKGIYAKKGTGAFPEYIYVAKKSAAAMQSILPYVEKNDLLTEKEKQSLKDYLTGIIDKNRELCKKLAAINANTGKDKITEVWKAYWGIVFPKGYVEDWYWDMDIEKLGGLLEKKGIVVLAYEWD